MHNNRFFERVSIKKVIIYCSSSLPVNPCVVYQSKCFGMEEEGIQRKWVCCRETVETSRPKLIELAIKYFDEVDVNDGYRQL